MSDYPNTERLDRVAIGERIRAKRIERGIKQTELAQRAGVRPHTMLRYEKGGLAPGSEVVSKIADMLGVASDWILYGKERGRVESRVERDGEASGVPEVTRAWLAKNRHRITFAEAEEISDLRFRDASEEVLDEWLTFIRDREAGRAKDVAKESGDEETARLARQKEREKAGRPQLVVRPKKRPT